MFTIHVQLTAEEAIFLMRAVAAKQWTEPDAAKRDDLELLRLKLYDTVYHRPSAPISIDTCQSVRFDAQRSGGPEQLHAPHRRIRSLQVMNLSDGGEAFPRSAA